MQYVTFVLCLDSNDPDDATAKANYDQYYPLIANKDEFDYINYFFAIKEAKNVRESSLVVFGSNASTGQIVNTKEIKTVADEITAEVIEAEQSLQTEKQRELLKGLLKKI
jgi:hypothetical protein